MVSAEQALVRLREGNRRFVAGRLAGTDRTGPLYGGGLETAQRPFAVVLGCSDSRVPVEIVFDQGPGDLFVIRVAGNIVAPSQIGSVELAVEQLGSRLVVVLGHSGCGAVAATLEEMARPTSGGSPHLRSIVDRVRSAVQPVMAGAPDDAEALFARAVRANALASARDLREGSGILDRLASRGELRIMAAEYSLGEGRVAFLDDEALPAA